MGRNKKKNCDSITQQLNSIICSNYINKIKRFMKIGKLQKLQIYFKIGYNYIFNQR